jgi:hypothetical protein
MHRFPPGDDARENDIVTPVLFPVLENHFLSLASGSSFVLGPGYQGIENGQLPQALPGQPHDGSLPVSSNPQAAAAPLFPASEIPQSAVGASNPLASATPSGLVTSAEPASALPSGSLSPQVSVLRVHIIWSNCATDISSHLRKPSHCLVMPTRVYSSP